jgi:transcriptional regulator with PAS, ATPase and Fis domain
VAVNCAARVETLLEAEQFGIEERTATRVRGRRRQVRPADDGTLFLDEMSDLSLSAQAKLLRAIQDLPVERVGGNSNGIDVKD